MSGLGSMDRRGKIELAAVVVGCLILILMGRAQSQKKLEEGKKAAVATVALPLAAPAVKVLSDWSQTTGNHRYRYIEIGGRIAVENNNGSFAFALTLEEQAAIIKTVKDAVKTIKNGEVANGRTKQ